MMRAIGLFAALAVGCAHAPRSESSANALIQKAQSALDNMEAYNQNVRPALDQSVGYIVFPEAWQGGLFAGGGAGRGVVFEHGQVVGFAELGQGSFGGEAGVQKFAEVIAVRDQATLDRMRRGTYDVGAAASAVISSAGTAKGTAFGANGVAVFIQPLAGAEVQVSLTAQRIKFF